MRVNDIDWSTLLGGGSFLGFCALVARDLIRAWVNKGKMDADAGLTGATREVTLAEATLKAMDRMQENYEARIRAVQADAQAQIAGTRADAANSVAASMHEVSTARNEASQARNEAAAMRNTVERIEQLLLRVRSVVWAPGDTDFRVDRVRELLGDGSVPLSAFVNGTPH